MTARRRWEPIDFRRSEIVARIISPKMTRKRDAIDTSKSLAELTGIDWGPAPAEAPILIRERHKIRRTPICRLPDDAIVRFLDMGIDAEVLVPIALERLLQDSEAVGLLCAVLRADFYDWRSHPDDVASLRERVNQAANEISQNTDDLERLQYEAAVWKFYAEFERRLSAM